jgi:hypothetical protein
MIALWGYDGNFLGYAQLPPGVDPSNIKRMYLEYKTIDSRISKTFEVTYDSEFKQ